MSLMSLAQKELTLILKSFSNSTRPSSSLFAAMISVPRAFERNGFGMSETEHQEQVKLLGRSPASYEEFINKTAEKWKMDVSE